MPKLPVDAPKRRAIKALEILGFSMVRDREHIAMIRDNLDGIRTSLTMPNQSTIKSSTIRAICTQANIPRADFLRAHECGISTAFSRLRSRRAMEGQDDVVIAA